MPPPSTRVLFGLGLEHDVKGDRAKGSTSIAPSPVAPRQGGWCRWHPSWIISKTSGVVAKLVPNLAAKRYAIEIHSGVSAAEMAEAAQGYRARWAACSSDEPGAFGSLIKDDPRPLRRRKRRQSATASDSGRGPNLCRAPKMFFRSELHGVQWIDKPSLSKARQKTYFAAVTEDDIARELNVEAIVA